MGTRARINVIDDGKVLVSIYRQMDGYPGGLGEEVATFLSSFEVTNGIRMDPSNRPTANGMGCLAAQLIKHLKDGVGSIYIRNTSPESHGEEYVYTVYTKGKDYGADVGKPYLRVSAGGMTMFGLPGDAEDDMTTLYDGPASAFTPEACKESA